jgi:predicted RecA/RadA family phage recombinase
MKTFVQEGDVIAVTVASGSDEIDLSSGDGYLIGSLFGIVVADAAIGETVQLQTEGVFDIAKTSAEAWTVGQKIYWNNATRKCTSTAGGNKQIGVATAVAANPSSTGRVLLTAAFTI